MRIFDKFINRFDNYKIEAQSPKPKTEKGNKSVIALAKEFFGAKKSEKMEIIHLGGTRVASHDPVGKHSKMSKDYFHEVIPLKIKGEKGEFFVDAKTQEKYVKEYMHEVRLGRTDQNFQKYMQRRIDREDGVAQEVNAARVRYLTDGERKQTAIVIKNNQLTQIGLDSSDKRLKPLKPGVYAFVIIEQADPKTGEVSKQLYATPKVMTETGSIRHSSFARGGNVLSAGAFEIDDDHVLVAVKNVSGHYKPTRAQTNLFLDYVKNEGIDTSHVKIIEHVS